MSCKNIKSEAIISQLNCDSINYSNRHYLEDIKIIMEKNDNFLSEKIKPYMELLSTSRKKTDKKYDKVSKNSGINFCFKPLVEYENKLLQNKIKINYKMTVKKINTTYKAKKLRCPAKILDKFTDNLKIFSSESDVINQIKTLPNSFEKLITGHSYELSRYSLSSIDSSVSIDNTNINSVKTLKKLVSIFSVKNNLHVHNIKTQVIEILNPTNKLSKKEKFKSLTDLLNDPNLSIATNSSYSSNSETFIGNENVLTQLAICYTNLIINNTKYSKYRTMSGSNIIVSLSPKYQSSYGGVDGLTNSGNPRSFSIANLKTDRESFKALSHMFTLKKLLGLEVGHKPKHSIRQSCSLSSEDKIVSSNEDEDSIDKELMKVFSQKIKEIVNKKSMNKYARKENILILSNKN